MTAMNILAAWLGALTLSTLPPLQASGAADWMPVTQIAAGERVRVELIGGAATEGRLLAADNDSVTVAAGTDTRRVARPDVRRLAVARSHRKRNVLIGLAAGGAAGIVGAAIGCRGQSAGCMEGSPLYFYPGVGIGALAGAALPATSWQTVYLIAAR